MKALIHYFLERSLLVNIISIMILIIGLLSAYFLKKETFPQVDFDVVLVRTAYPGSSAEDVEKLVTISIERELKAVNGIEEVNAMSLEGVSIIYVKVDADSQVDEVLEDVKTAVDRVDDFPDDVETPYVSKIDSSRSPILKVALFGIEQNKLNDVARDLRDQLEDIDSVAIVTLEGHRDKEIRVELDPTKLNQNELTVTQVTQAIQQENINLSAGNLKSSSGEVSIRTLSELKTADDVANVVVRSNNDGVSIKVSDLGAVDKKLEEEVEINRSQGQKAIFLDIKKKYSADIIRTTDKIKQVVEDFFESNKIPKLEYRYTDDSSYYVKRRLEVLTSSGIQGLILVFTCLLLFLNFRTSFVTSLGAPVAFMVSFALMDSFGISINLVSMFGLIMVLGMLVDDSIIVSEQFYQYLELGMHPREAAYKASIETIKPITATILTTVVAFGSLFFMGGIMGKFLWSVPAAVIICLLASWLECFFILPSHLADFVKLEKKHIDKLRWYDRFRNLYSRVLHFFLRFNVLFVVAFVLIFISSIIVGKNMEFELFPGDDVRIVVLNYKGKVGTSLEKTSHDLKTVEDYIFTTLKKNEYDQLRTVIGKQFKEQANASGGHYASMILYLTTPDQRDRSTDEIVTELEEGIKKLVPQYNLAVRKIQGGPPKGSPLQIDLMGDNLDELKVVSKQVLSMLQSTRGIVGPEIDFEEGKEQVVISVLKEEAKRLGLSTSQVALEIRRAFSGDSVSEVRESDEDIDIRVLLAEEYRKNIKDLRELYILNNSGRRIALSQVAKLEVSPGSFVIRRFNRKRIISVTSSLDKELTTPVKMAQDLKEPLNKILQDHSHVKYAFGGENKDTQESIIRLGKSAIIALGCIFIILVAMFGSLAQSSIIMSAIPLGMIGVVYTFKLMGLPFGFMALMGIVGLIGVVVNDSIVLINSINLKREEIESHFDAIYEACISRFRPVILTTFTTVVGLLPIAHPSLMSLIPIGDVKDGDPFLRPMALSFAYGLLFSSMVTLVFVPCAYKLIYDLKKFFKKLILSRKMLRDQNT